MGSPATTEWEEARERAGGEEEEACPLHTSWARTARTMLVNEGGVEGEGRLVSGVRQRGDSTQQEKEKEEEGPRAPPSSL